MVRRQTCWPAAILIGLTAGCGNDADFGGGQPHANGSDATAVSDPGTQSSTDDTPAPENPTNPIDPNLALSGLTWYWQCSGQPGQAPEGSATAPVVQNEGPFNINKDQLQQTPLTFAGHLCPPAQQPRDIIFVIDTSGSMGSPDNNDPRTGSTCARLAAIKAVIASTPAGTARFGLATFSSSLNDSSTGLYETEAELFAAIAPQGNIADVVCDASGNTNYDAGLSEAEVLLKGGRADATKEIYFVSDGAPTTGQEGAAVAQSLKTIGVNIGTNFIPVTIATVMLGSSNDAVLRNQIASKDAAGAALHAEAARANQLAKVLTDLAKNDIVSASLSYRLLGEDEDWTKVDLLTHMQGYDFTLPSITIDKGSAATGLEVQYQYRDRHNHRVATGGKILWTDANPASNEGK